MRLQIAVGLLALAITIGSCNKNKDTYKNTPPGYGSIRLQLNYNVDGAPLYFDSMMYQNKAGNIYSVSRLQYYISGIKFYKGTDVAYSIDSVYYIDATVTATNTIQISNMPSWEYDAISFYIGVENKLNEHGKIAPTQQNNAMEWPDMMGGGYHFLKLEGHFKDSTQNTGYAMHLGSKDMQPACTVYKNIYVPANTTSTSTLNMNINEWFKNPYTYDFSKDGVYTMGNMMLMGKIKSNGTDVFNE